MNIFKGWFGEKKATFKMWLLLDDQVYKRYHDIIIPSSNGTTQIDHLLISQFGIFIVETKNKDGWIFGDANNATWTQVVFGKKFAFQNPLRQTYRQKKVLAEFLSIDESAIHVIVYFVGDSKFKTQLPANVIKSGLASYIKSFNIEMLSQNEVSRISAVLVKHISESQISAKEHVRSLKERHTSNTKCPKCGANLKLRTVKNGNNAGDSFLGCENYPKCRFTKSI